MALYTEQVIPVSTKSLPIDYEFLFEPTKQTNLTLFANLIDHAIIGVLARNDIDILV